MKIAGLLLLPAGWFLVLSAVVMLRAAGPQALFVLAGFLVELLALALLLRAHWIPRGGHE
jgi:hypothetical protein